MNTHRAVREYLAKENKVTELASERVELALLDDLQQQSNEADDLSKRGKALKAEIKNTKKLFDDADKEYTKKIKLREKAKDRFEKARSEMVKFESEFEQARTSANSTLNDIRAYDKGLKQEEKDLSKLEKQASKVRKRLSDNIAKAQQAEKNLGVKMPRLKDYVKTLQDLNTSFRN